MFRKDSSEVIAVAVAHEASVRVESAYRVHHECVWFFAESSNAVSSQCNEMAQVIDPHPRASIVCVDGHADVVNEQQIVSQEDAV